MLRVWSFHKRLPNNTSRQRGRTNSANVQYRQRSDIITDATNRCGSGQTEQKSYRSYGIFKLIEGENGPTTCLPSGSELGGVRVRIQIRDT